MRRITKKILKTIVCAILLCAISVSSTLAYMTYTADPLVNHTTIALDATCVIFEYFPTVTATITSTSSSATSEINKLVQVANDGYTDEYVRLGIKFTSSDLEDHIYLLSSETTGTKYYALATYISKYLPDGWVYDETIDTSDTSEDGYLYFYYTYILEANDDFSSIAESVATLDDEQYYYEYNSSNSVLDSAQQSKSGYSFITTPLFDKVKAEWDTIAELDSYGMIIFADCVPFYWGDDYKSAWQTYLALSD